MRTLEVRLDWGGRETVVGTLAEEGRRIFFEYAASFPESPLPISPFKLPARPGLFEHAEREFAPLFGVFDDSLPGSWGILLMDREFKRQGRSLQGVSPLDRLAYIGTRGMGALTYHPPRADAETEPLEVDLGVLAREAERVLEGSADEVLPGLRVAERCDVEPRKARAIIEQVRDAVGQWPRFAGEAGVPGETAREIRRLIAARVE